MRSPDNLRRAAARILPGRYNSADTDSSADSSADSFADNSAGSSADSAAGRHCEDPGSDFRIRGRQKQRLRFVLRTSDNIS